MNKLAKKATILGIVGNIVLFLLKTIVGIAYGSIAVISDAINSFTDIIASIIVFISVKVSSKMADDGHPFGHHRAEPIAGLIVAIFTGILGFEVIIIAFNKLLIGDGFVRGIAPIIVMGFTLVVKFGMYIYCVKVGREVKSTAIMASAKDHRNDVLISLAALLGVSGAYVGYGFLDPLVALLIGGWVIYSGYEIGVDNIKFLMGEAPSLELMEKIKDNALKCGGVKGINDVRAHYVGVLLQVEVHIEVDRKLTIYRAHSIGKKVQHCIENMEDVDRAFVHIDPVS